MKEKCVHVKWNWSGMCMFPSCLLKVEVWQCLCIWLLCFSYVTLLTGLLLVCRWGTGDWDASWILLAAVVNCLPCWCSEALIFPTKEVCISHKGLEIGFKYVCLLNLEFLERWQCNPSYASGLYAFSWGDIVVVKHWEVSMISQFVQLYWCLMSAASFS